MDIKAAFSSISSSDMAKVKEFYSNTLGLKLKTETMGLEYDLPGGGTMFIYEKPDHAPAVFTVLNFTVGDIDKAVDELTSKGVTFERYPQLPFEQDEKGIARAEKPEDGPTIAWFKDPVGNILALLQA